MSARMKRYCSCHCRCCDGHFTSLAAFDAHGPRHGGCQWPDKPKLIERTGACRVSDPQHPAKRVTLYEHPDAQRAREDFRARERASAER
jgi:hypothetical protein